MSLGVNETALTAMRSGIVTNTGTGITTPDRSDIKDCPPIHNKAQQTHPNEISNKLRSSYLIEFKAKGKHERYTAHCSQTGIPGPSSNMTHETPQKEESEPVEAGEDTILVEPHLKPSRDSDRPLVQRRESEEGKQTDGSQYQKGLATEAVDVVGVTKQEQATVTANTNRNDHNNPHEVNMSELLKTSNRLLEDGRRLLAGGERKPRPRQVHKSVGEESSGEPVNKGPDSPPRTNPSEAQGWYAHDLME